MEPGIPISPDKIEEARKKRLTPEVIDKINDILVKRYNNNNKHITIDYDEICEIFNSDHNVIEYAHVYIKSYYKDYNWAITVQKNSLQDEDVYSLIFSNLLVSIFK